MVRAVTSLRRGSRSRRRRRASRPRRTPQARRTPQGCPPPRSHAPGPAAHDATHLRSSPCSRRPRPSAWLPRPAGPRARWPRQTGSDAARSCISGTCRKNRRGLQDVECPRRGGAPKQRRSRRFADLCARRRPDRLQARLALRTGAWQDKSIPCQSALPRTPAVRHRYHAPHREWAGPRCGPGDVEALRRASDVSGISGSGETRGSGGVRGPAPVRPRCGRCRAGGRFGCGGRAHRRRGCPAAGEERAERPARRVSPSGVAAVPGPVQELHADHPARSGHRVAPHRRGLDGASRCSSSPCSTPSAGCVSRARPRAP